MAITPSKNALTDSNGFPIPWHVYTGIRPEIPPELANALAGIVVEWSAFENTIVSDTATMMQYSNVRRLTDKPPGSFKHKIVLWKRAVHTLYPKIEAYIEMANEICSKGKTVAHARHRLIHREWVPPQAEDRDYEVIVHEGLDTVTKFDHVVASVDYLTAVRDDIKTVSDALTGFLINRMIHAQAGLLKAEIVPNP